MKEYYSRREKFEFVSPPQPSPAKPLLPPYFSITNGSMLEHLQAANGGGGLIALGKAAPSGNNGFSHHPHATGHAHCLPQLLLPEALLGAKLQVKDLLSPSPVDRNILYMDEASCTAARTRYGIYSLHVRECPLLSLCVCVILRVDCVASIEHYCADQTEELYARRLGSERATLLIILLTWHFILNCPWHMVRSRS